MSLQAFLSQAEDGVFYMGHASVLVQLSGKRYLFDYVQGNKPYGDVWVFFPELVRGLDPRMLDGVFVSHCHQDHLDLPMLQSLREVCPLYILDGRPEFNALLAAHGLTPTLIPPNTRHVIADGVEVYGVLHETNGVDASTVIASPRFSVYHGNDNYARPETLAVFRRLYGDIDVGCIPYAYINWYPFLLDNITAQERESEAERLIHHYYDLALAQADAMGAKVVIPFGANLVYHDDAYSPMNLAVKTPLEFEAYVRATRGEAQGRRCQALFGGDVVLRGADGVPVVQAQAFDRSGYRDQMQAYLRRAAADEAAPGPAPAPVDIDTHLPQLADKVARLEPLATAHDIRVEGRSAKDLKLSIDLQGRTVTQHANWSDAPEGRPYHLFHVEDALLAQWVRSEIRFEEIIGARKFTLSRVPNVYNPDVLRMVSTGL
jgi:L-ascorbate metabolism protein UlaG (beta-lactamase superfamily)